MNLSEIHEIVEEYHDLNEAAKKCYAEAWNLVSHEIGTDDDDFNDRVVDKMTELGVDDINKRRREIKAELGEASTKSQEALEGVDGLSKKKSHIVMQVAQAVDLIHSNPQKPEQISPKMLFDDISSALKRDGRSGDEKFAEQKKKWNEMRQEGDISIDSMISLMKEMISIDEDIFGADLQKKIASL